MAAPREVIELAHLLPPLSGAKTRWSEIALHRRIEATDKQIDQLVYKVCGLMYKETRIIEEATKCVSNLRGPHLAIGYPKRGRE